MKAVWWIVSLFVIRLNFPLMSSSSALASDMEKVGVLAAAGEEWQEAGLFPVDHNPPHPPFQLGALAAAQAGMNLCCYKPLRFRVGL